MTTTTTTAVGDHGHEWKNQEEQTGRITPSLWLPEKGGVDY